MRYEIDTGIVQCSSALAMNATKCDVFALVLSSFEQEKRPLIVWAIWLPCLPSQGVGNIVFARCWNRTGRHQRLCHMVRSVHGTFYVVKPLRIHREVVTEFTHRLFPHGRHEHEMCVGFKCTPCTLTPIALTAVHLPRIELWNLDSSCWTQVGVQ